tara:strand:- start:2197 stop:3051 length:855 start_codon:yes stop_codon:yes gene_type:complete
MTAAADRLFLTQSGVSQHIRSLENTLGFTLFDRINQKLIPTNAARELYETCQNSLNSIEKTLRSFKEDESGLIGTIHIGMPIEFGNNLVIPLLSKFGQIYPEIKFEIYFDYADKLNEMLLNGDIEFAFVDEYKMDRRVTTEIVYTEKLYLCATDEYIATKEKKSTEIAFYESLDYVDYQRHSPILKMWFEHHYKDKKVKLNTRANVMDVQGISKFITSHFSAGILPLHIIRSLEKNGYHIHIFKFDEKDLENHISVAYIKERSIGMASEKCLAYLRDELAKTTF